MGQLATPFNAYHVTLSCSQGHNNVELLGNFLHTTPERRKMNSWLVWINFVVGESGSGQEYIY